MKTMKTTTKFKQVKSEILKLADMKCACKSGYEQAESANTVNQLIEAIKDNIGWCIIKEIATAENMVRWFGVDVLKKNRIYTSGSTQVVARNAMQIVLLGDAHVSVETLGKCNVFIHTSENSIVSVTTREQSEAILGSFFKSSAIMNARDKSSLHTVSYDYTSVEVNTFDNSDAFVITYDDSYTNVNTFDDSKVTARQIDETSTLLIDQQ